VSAVTDELRRMARQFRNQADEIASEGAADALALAWADGHREAAKDCKRRAARLDRAEKGRKR
jgi:Holliday junction resolvasome RuvABC endonuclease subunit